MRVTDPSFLSEVATISEMEGEETGEAEADSASIAAVKRCLNNIAEANET